MPKLRYYRVKLIRGKSISYIKTASPSIRSLVDTVMVCEGCPEKAIKQITLIEPKNKKS